MYASLGRLARVAPEGPFRSLFASLLRAASLREDLFARAMYLEGVMAYGPGALYKNPKAFLDPAREAFNSDSSDNPLVEALRYKLGMSDRDIGLMLGYKDTGIFQALIRGAQKGMGSLSNIRGLMPEDIASSIAAGISPVTLKSMKYGPNRGVFHYLGERAPSNTSIRGIVNVTEKEAFNRTLDIVRKTSPNKIYTVDFDSPLKGEDGESLSLAQLLADDTPLESASYQDLASAIFTDPWVMSVINNKVLEKLTTPNQIAVWNAIRQDPSLLIPSPSGMSVAGKALAKIVTQALGTPYTDRGSDVSVTKTFREKVLPAMSGALNDSDIAQRLLKNRAIAEIIAEATRGVPPTNKQRGIGYEGEGATPTRGPGDWDHSLSELSNRKIKREELVAEGEKLMAQGQSLVEEGRATKNKELYTQGKSLVNQGKRMISEGQGLSLSPEDQAWYDKAKARLMADPEFRQLEKWGFGPASVLRVASRYSAKKKAWNLPPREAMKYKKLKDWAVENWKMFELPKGGLNTDGLARALARQAGQPGLEEDPQHWIYEIAYDLDRAVQRRA